MRPTNFKSFIHDIIEAIDKRLRYLDHIDGLEDFLNNEMLIDAVIRNYEVIGEAANRIPKSIQTLQEEGLDLID